jgi:hypothetical protein
MAASALRRILGALFRGEKRMRTSLVVSSAGLTIAPLRGEPKSLSVPWSDVERVTVFKRDRMTVDEICMVLEVSGSGALEVNEEMPGWQELVQALPTHLPGARLWDEWFGKVAFPAFTTNPEVVFERRLTGRLSGPA